MQQAADIGFPLCRNTSAIHVYRTLSVQIAASAKSSQQTLLYVGILLGGGFGPDRTRLARISLINGNLQGNFALLTHFVGLSS